MKTHEKSFWSSIILYTITAFIALILFSLSACEITTADIDYWATTPHGRERLLMIIKSDETSEELKQRAKYHLRVRRQYLYGAADEHIK